MSVVVIYSVLLIGVLSISSAAIMIRMIDAPALAIVFYRLAIASLMITPIAIVKSYGNRLPKTSVHFIWYLVAAVALAVHFSAWTMSLEHTSVVNSVVLVTSSPLLVAIGSFLTFRERISRFVVAGIVLGGIGGGGLTIGDFVADGNQLYGDMLAMLGSGSIAVYYLVGRKVRQEISNLRYIFGVYGWASLILFGVVVLTCTRISGFSHSSYVLILLVAILPQLIGHSALNWVLGHISATLVALAIMAEPVIATWLAWILLEEIPPATSIVGGGILILGVLLAFWNPDNRLATVQQTPRDHQ
ncbi:uncharacterized protein METZ01_LOCUS290835 [marine metagenome]|uniref:EamA domain-containing protein n=1 Tax=marine metagenome TaxID=408172 RepID=A0A382LSU6_9ZZZZ